MEVENPSTRRNFMGFLLFFFDFMGSNGCIHGISWGIFMDLDIHGEIMGVV
jgi:hypothetical protein